MKALRRTVTFLDNLMLAWIRAREFQAAYDRFDRMTDRRLAELGLSRGDVVRAAWQEAEQRTAARRAPESADARNAPPRPEPEDTATALVGGA